MPAACALSPEQATSLAKTVATQLVAPRSAGSLFCGRANPNGGPPPPYRGAPLSRAAAGRGRIAPDTPPHESAERLLAATEGALARTTLLQAASLPEQLGVQRSEAATQRWTFEVPFATPQGTGIAQFEVSRDAEYGPRRKTCAGGARVSRSTSSRWGRCMRWSRSRANARTSRSGPNAPRPRHG